MTLTWKAKPKLLVHARITANDDLHLYIPSIFSWQNVHQMFVPGIVFPHFAASQVYTQCTLEVHKRSGRMHCLIFLDCSLLPWEYHPMLPSLAPSIYNYLFSSLFSNSTWDFSDPPHSDGVGLDVALVARVTLDILPIGLDHTPGVEYILTPMTRNNRCMFCIHFRVEKHG